MGQMPFSFRGMKNWGFGRLRSWQVSLLLILLAISLSAPEGLSPSSLGSPEAFNSLVSQIREDRARNPDQGEALGIDTIYGMKARAETLALEKERTSSNSRPTFHSAPQPRLFNFFRHHPVHLRAQGTEERRVQLVEQPRSTRDKQLRSKGRAEELAGQAAAEPGSMGEKPTWLKDMQAAASQGPNGQVSEGLSSQAVVQPKGVGLAMSGMPSPANYGRAGKRQETGVEGPRVGDSTGDLRGGNFGSGSLGIDSAGGQGLTQKAKGAKAALQANSPVSSHPLRVERAGIGIINSVMPWGSNKTVDEEEDAKIKLGIQMMSNTEKDQTILRCFDDGPFMDPRNVKAPNVSVGIYLLNLAAEKGLTEGTFFADFLVFFRREDRPLQRFGTQELIDQIAITNARKIDLTTNYHQGIWRMGGTFLFSPDLRWFPFDTQDLEIIMEQLRVPVRDFQFIPDSHLNGMSPFIRFPGWQASLRVDSQSKFARCSASSGKKILPAMNRWSEKVPNNNLTFSRFSYNVQVTRPFWQGVLTHMIPPAIMLTPALFSYALNPIVHSTTQLGSCSSSIVSILLFHIGIAGELPPVDYLTFFDKYIFAVYCTLFMALFSAMSCSVIYRNESIEDLTKDMKEALFEKNCIIGIYSTVVIFAVALPIWAFCSSRAASLLLIPMALGGVIWVWIQWSDLKAEIANLHGTELPAPIDAGKTSDDNDV